MTKSFYFPAPLSHLGELPIDRLLVFQDPIPAAGDALLRAHDAQSKFGATQGHDGDTALWASVSTVVWVCFVVQWHREKR